jgi:hypothetical protein
MKRFLFILFVLLFSDCKKTLPDNIQKSLLNILSENQLIQEKLLKNEIPELDTLKKSLKLSIEDAKLLPELQTQLGKLSQGLSEKKLNTEDTYVQLSKFSEDFSKILLANDIKSEYNRFYCPMVSKYWIAKGIEVQNPYAADMRDCGELVK